MSTTGPDTRTRIGEAAAVLFRRNGYTGTGLKQISAEAGAPFGSIYHFFPGGKQHLADDVIRTTGPAYMQLVLGLLRSVDDPVVSIERAFNQAAEDLTASGYADACPVATVALEVANTNEALRVATADVFTDWVTDLSGWFAPWCRDEEARSLALSTIMILEGAFVLSRATRDPEPLRVAGRSMAALLRPVVERA